ncbi:uncharacterized protein N7484_002585 [Penicillium longicatenatum]|uniref:uncharacterized protein n=1 Tax=Penicillium longicatenatum TaxID=1561947 RepID=UPI00254730B2|nr:uncharacterized protein N7484_002585 [Penicillium longicatenatum]KAJ5648862.1 hypothetical protein N7484_002585 [Penicillium longicatenatum]
MAPRTKPKVHHRKKFAGRRHGRAHKRSSDLTSPPKTTGSRRKPPRSKAPAGSGILPDSNDPLEENIFERAAMPEDYVFVPKGNVYITRHCRTDTKTSNRVVYLVYDKAAKRTLGIRVPDEIHKNVSKRATLTAEKRASAVQVRDETFIMRGRALLYNEFPLMPHETLETILNHAFLKGSGRVGRTSTTTEKRKATLAVEAHIRHKHTNYETLLASGVERCEARERVWQNVKVIRKAWEGSKELKKIETVLRPAHTDGDDDVDDVPCIVVSDDDDVIVLD